jgi:hypothetical protein
LQANVGLPELFGSPICLRMQPELRAYRGKLLSGTEHGTAVHAASFIRRREIVLESALAARPSYLRFILVHEIFHFVWPRLGNGLRAEFRALLEQEKSSGARGEMGESAEVQKLALARDGGEARWREYVCESFCDSAAALFSGVNGEADRPLAARWRDKRKKWFEEVFARPRFC